MKFDNIEYEVLITANSDNFSGYYPESPHKDRVFELMEEGIITYNAYENWYKNGYELSERGKEYYNEFMQKVSEKHGHVWMTNYESHPDIYDEDEKGANEIDYFALSYGYHNGPKCKNCGFSFCHHCESEFEIEECPNKIKL